MWLLIMCLCVSCTAGASQPSPPDEFPESLPGEETVPVTEKPDTEGPVISGAQDLTAPAGGSLSYRNGVIAWDKQDGDVALQIDSSGVDLNTPGEYQVIYSAQDSSGNRSEVTVTVVITEPETSETPQNTGTGTSTSKLNAKNATLADVEALADKILAKIITNGMSQTQKARAIYNYVRSHVKYVGTSDKSSWIVGAYVGFTTGRGDCFNYFACSKALLTRAGIPNVDLQRVGGPTRHYWQLVDVGTGYYHFDACPHDSAYPLASFMLTEAEAREYTSWRGKNYYVYDYASCPVTVASTPFSGTAWHAPHWTPSTQPEPVPEVTPEPTVEPTPDPVPEVTPGPQPDPVPEVTPEPTPDPVPEVTPEPTPEPVPEVTPEPTPDPTVPPEGLEG